jgi:hypothetical protein
MADCGAAGHKVTPGMDPWIKHAIEHIHDLHGDTTSMEGILHAQLLKFGRHTAVQTALTTLMTLPTGVYNETFVAGNLINTAVSTNDNDTTTLTIQGHTVSGSGVNAQYTEVFQDVTLNGNTPVPLAIPLARCQRAYANAAVALLGTVSFSETDTYTGDPGVPDTDAKVHMQIRLGENQTEKTQLTVSNNQWLIITGFGADCLEKSATFGSVVLERREAGKLFLPVTTSAASTNYNTEFKTIPYIEVHPNSDVRLRATAGANGKDFTGTIVGVYLGITS